MIQCSLTDPLSLEAVNAYCGYLETLSYNRRPCLESLRAGERLGREVTWVKY